MSEKLTYFFIILIFAGLIGVVTFATILPQLVFAEHIRQHGEYVIHPQMHHYDQFNEIHIIEVFIQSKSHPDCATGFGLNERGECTDIKFHYDVYPLYLVQEIPSFCDNRALGCILDKGIYIVNGKQGHRPSFGSCSVLWHEIRHLMIEGTDEYYEHQWMKENEPNSECATPKHPVIP